MMSTIATLQPLPMRDRDILVERCARLNDPLAFSDPLDVKFTMQMRRYAARRRARLIIAEEERR